MSLCSCPGPGPPNMLSGSSNALKPVPPRNPGSCPSLGWRFLPFDSGMVASFQLLRAQLKITPDPSSTTPSAPGALSQSHLSHLSHSPEESLKYLPLGDGPSPSGRTDSLWSAGRTDSLWSDAVLWVPPEPPGGDAASPESS